MSSIQSAQPSSSSSTKTFDFTKRKRWADLLATDLAEGTNFVLSAACVVLYCGPTIQELIGWRDEELVDHNLLEFLSSDDQGLFSACLDESLQTNSRLHAFVRFKCSEGFMSSHTPETKQVLFEVKGRPQHLKEVDGKLLFVTVKPYPSHNTDMLNIFLDLKIEHEQLQAQLLELRRRLPPDTLNIFATASQNQVISSQPHSTSGAPRTGSDLLYTVGSSGLMDFTGNKASGGISSTEGTGFVPLSAPGPAGPVTADDDGDDGQKKKKIKKSHLNEQYVCVTCGRTDSPEWRKGPLGPKTLCNACGLRWAKQSRKADDPVAQGNDGGGDR